MTQNNIFAGIVERKIPAQIVYEDENHLAFLDIFPFEKGHTLVIPKKEYETIMDMPEDEFLELQKVVFRVAKHIAGEFGCGINIIQNNGKISGQEIPHVHFHIIPRKIEKSIFRLDNKDLYLPNEIENYQRRLVMKNG